MTPLANELARLIGPLHEMISLEGQGVYVVSPAKSTPANHSYRGHFGTSDERKARCQHLYKDF
jgi:hypothetical protein